MGPPSKRPPTYTLVVLTGVVRSVIEAVCPVPGLVKRAVQVALVGPRGGIGLRWSRRRAARTCGAGGTVWAGYAGETSASTLAAQIRSFSEMPPIECVEYRTRHLL